MKEIINQIKNLATGDLVLIEWSDASIGKSLSNGVNGIDVPVKSWGIFIGELGQKRKHIILAQNCFRYSDGLYDIDYTAVPLPWTTSADSNREAACRRRGSAGSAQKLHPKHEGQKRNGEFWALPTPAEGA